MATKTGKITGAHPARLCECCKEEIKPTHVMKCSIVSCQREYTHTCGGFTDQTYKKLTAKDKKEWICPTCKCSARRPGDYTNSPLGTRNDDKQKIGVQDLRTDEPNANASHITLRALGSRRTSPLPPVGTTAEPDALLSLTTEIQLMRQDMHTVHDNLQNLNMSFKQYGERLTELENRVTQKDMRIRALEDQAIDNDMLRSRITQLEEQLNSQAQARLGNEVEVIGVNEFPNENKAHIVLTAALKMSLNLKEEDLDSVTRAGPRGLKVSVSEMGSGLPRPLVVKFVRRAKRNEFLKAAKSRRTLNSASIEVPGPTNKLYFNERLTKSNRELFRETRMQSKKASYKFCWTRNGTIYIRKRDGEPESAIRNAADLKKCLDAGAGAGAGPASATTPATSE